MKSLKGHLLLASAALGDSNFAQTVVLIIQHDDSGALGVVLNRATELSVAEACEKAIHVPCAIEGKIHQGGPCEGLLMVLHQEEALGDSEIIPGVYFTADREKIESLLQDERTQAKYLVGYAGWSAGQLEGELESGSWLTRAAEIKSIFADDPRQWARLMNSQTLGKLINPKIVPEDPSLN